MLKWNIIANEGDIENLPRNIHANNYSVSMLVTSTIKRTLNEVYLMYYDFADKHFHFHNYAPDWQSVDIKLKPIEEIDRWMELPEVPNLMS